MKNFTVTVRVKGELKTAECAAPSVDSAIETVCSFWPGAKFVKATEAGK